MWDVKFHENQHKLFLYLRFTLTMWDVKSDDIYISFDFQRFYLNYVGCKGIIRIQISPLVVQVLP